MATRRITERVAARALLDTCQHLGIDCAYDSDGTFIAGRSGHFIDHAPQYGGARVHYRPANSGAHMRADNMLTRAGIPSGMDKRVPLRELVALFDALCVGERIR